MATDCRVAHRQSERQLRSSPTLALQDAGPIISFDFRKLHFILDPKDGMFHKLKYPTKVLPQLPVFACQPAARLFSRGWRRRPVVQADAVG